MKNYCLLLLLLMLCSCASYYYDEYEYSYNVDTWTGYNYSPQPLRLYTPTANDFYMSNYGAYDGLTSSLLETVTDLSQFTIRSLFQRLMLVH